MKTINCPCGVGLGEIIEGRIRKGTVHLCNKCYTRLVYAEKMLLDKQKGAELPDELKNIFGRFV